MSRDPAFIHSSMAISISSFTFPSQATNVTVPAFAARGHSALTLPNDAVVADAANLKRAIGSLYQIVGNIETDKTVGTGNSVDLLLYAFLFTGYFELAASPTAPVALPAYHILITENTQTGTWLELNFIENTPSSSFNPVQARNQYIGKVYISISSLSPLQFYFLFLTQLHSDRDALLSNPLNTRKLDRGLTTFANSLDNGSPSVYNALSPEHIAVRVQMFEDDFSNSLNWNTASTLTHFEYNPGTSAATAGYQHRFWNRDTGDAALTEITNPSFTFEANGSPVTSLYTQYSNAVTFTADYLTPGDVTAVQFILFEALDDSQNQTSLNWIQNLNPSMIDVPATQAFQDYMDLFYGMPNLYFQTPEQAFTIVSGSTYSFRTTIDGSTLDPSKQYWIGAIIIYDNTHDDKYSFLHPERLSVSTERIICEPQVCGRIVDYSGQTQKDCMVVTPQERILSEVFLGGLGYDFCGGETLLNAISRVELQTFAYEDGNRHNFSYDVLTPDVNGNFPPTNGITLAVDPVYNGVQLKFPFRVRYENTPNISSYIYDLANDTYGGGGAPQSTNNWTNRTIYIEYRFFLDQGNGVDEIIYRQAILIHDYDSTVMSLTIRNENGIDVFAICEEDEALELCVQKTDDGDDIFIPMLDTENFGIQNIVEENAQPGLLDQLDTDVFSMTDPTFVNNEACTRINVDALVTGREHQFVAVKKNSENIARCGDRKNVGLISTQITYDYIDLNLEVGEVVVVFVTGGTFYDGGAFNDRMQLLYECVTEAYDYYGAMRGVDPGTDDPTGYGIPRFIVDDTADLIERTAMPGTNTGLIEGAGYLTFNYDAFICCGTILGLKVSPDANSVGTGWGYISFCPSDFSECPFQYSETFGTTNRSFARKIRLPTNPGWVTLDYDITNGICDITLFYDKKKVARTSQDTDPISDNKAYTSGTGQLRFYNPGVQPGYPDYFILTTLAFGSQNSTVNISIACSEDNPTACDNVNWINLDSRFAYYNVFDVGTAAGTVTIEYDMTINNGSGYYLHAEFNGQIVATTPSAQFTTTDGTMTINNLPAGPKLITVYALKRLDGPDINLVANNSCGNTIRVRVSCAA